jgi:hypothetical protein
MSQPFLHQFLNDLVEQIKQQRLEAIKNESIDAKSIPNEDDDYCSIDYPEDASIKQLAESLLAGYLITCLDKGVLPANKDIPAIMCLKDIINDA